MIYIIHSYISLMVHKRHNFETWEFIKRNWSFADFKVFSQISEFSLVSLQIFTVSHTYVNFIHVGAKFQAYIIKMSELCKFINSQFLMFLNLNIYKCRNSESWWVGVHLKANVRHLNGAVFILHGADGCFWKSGGMKCKHESRKKWRLTSVYTANASLQGLLVQQSCSTFLGRFGEYFNSEAFCGN